MPRRCTSSTYVAVCAAFSRFSRLDGVARVAHIPQECFPDGYTPVTANTMVALGNLLIKREVAVDATSKGQPPARHESQARKQA